MEIQSIMLENGIQILHKQVPYTQVLHCGFVMDTGSRDELSHEMGMAHFIEHMIFKGTTRRKTFHILNYLESVGGDLNAYTTKEKTCYFASISADYFTRALDLLTDITFNSTFPEKEMVKERQVIAEEIDMYADSPEEAIFDDFDQVLFPGHTLGHPILGSKESISQFTREQLQAFTQRNYAQGKIVFSVVGNVSWKKVLRDVKKYLEPLKIPNGHLRTLNSGNLDSDQRQRVQKKIQQSHTIIGNRSFPVGHPLYYAFYLLNNYLGGPAMNSRLSLNIREKYGLSYNIYSFNSPYRDTGAWGIYYGCEPGNRDRLESLVRKELKQLRTQTVKDLKLGQIKKQLIGQTRLSYENLLSQTLAFAKEWLNFKRPFSLAENERKIEAVTAEQLMEAANQVFAEDNLRVLIYDAAEA